MSRLAECMQVLHGRELTVEEKNSLLRFQDMYEIGEDDPLVVVMAMLGESKMMLESTSDIIFQKAIETIELHQQTLCEQSTLIAKELIVTLFQNIKAGRDRNSWKDQLIENVFFLLLGGLAGGVLLGRLLR